MNIPQQNMMDMIQNGAFGTTSPFMNPPEYQPQGNMIPFGGYNVYQQPQQYSYYNNNLYGGQNNQNFIFQPVNGGYNPPSPYGNISPYQQQGSYSNPYGNIFTPQYQQQPYPTSYYSSYGYQSYYSPLAIAKMQEEQTNMFKLKCRIVNSFFGKETNEKMLDAMCNAQNQTYNKTAEQIQDEEDIRFVMHLSDISNGLVPESEIAIDRAGKMINLMSYNLHKEFDNHSLCQFLEEDLWRLQRDNWVRENIQLNNDRNLSKVYNSSDYNELLRLHNSSNSPYTSQLLDNSRYDNNLDDLELGVQSAMDRARRRQAILEGRIPELVSSEEAQQRRGLFTQSLMQQIYRKGASTNV